MMRINKHKKKQSSSITKNAVYNTIALLYFAFIKYTVHFYEYSMLQEAEKRTWGHH